MKPSSIRDNVSSALSHLSETLDEEKDLLNEEAAQAMKEGEYDTATALIQFTKRLLGFKAEIEALMEKWEELAAARGGINPQVQNIVRPGTIQIRHPKVAPLPRHISYKGISDTTVHCFHILDVLEEMGGVARNQDVSNAVNKRVKMLYPKFKQARALLSHQGWTEHNGSNNTLEISDKGARWLHSQKEQIVNQATDVPRPMMPEQQGTSPSHLPEDESGPFI